MVAEFTSQIFIDESGTARQTPFFAYGALKFGSDLGLLVNKLDRLRSTAGIRAEARFSNTNYSNLEFHKALIDAVHGSRGRFAAVVVKRDNDHSDVKQWKSQAFYTIEAIKFSMSDQERAAAIVDHVSVPREVNFEYFIQNAINSRYADDDKRLVSVVRMASEACWGLQLADLLTGAVHFSHRLDQGDGGLNPASTRGQLAEHVRIVFNIPTLHTAASPRFRVREMFKKTP